ncbi:hypothetical protein BH23ACT5_BH23ACT5_10190 [soil metagenome]
MTDPFVAHRSLLFTVAYEMLGSAAEGGQVARHGGCVRRWNEYGVVPDRDTDLG